MVRRIGVRLSPEIEVDLRAAAEEDRRSVQQTVLLAIEFYLARRETAEVKADVDTLRALAEAREQVCRGELYSTEDVRAALNERPTRSA